MDLQGIFSELKSRLGEPCPRIQVLLGPRQVGKTTAVKRLMGEISRAHYATADALFHGDWAWITEQWQTARSLGSNSLLILDEIQKIEGWSEIIKKLWDESVTNGPPLRVILLGSSSLDLRIGLGESLAGRFELLRARHWGLREWQAEFGGTLEDYLVFGGYPGAAAYQTDEKRWMGYLQTSILESVIERDIMQQTRIARPALFKQVFELCCRYPASELSLRKMIGQLQDPGSLETIQHYLQILSSAFMVETIGKFSTNALRKKASSPKLMPLAPALVSFGRQEVRIDSEERGRLFELIVGHELLKMPGSVFYWREGNDEVDFVFQRGKTLLAIEVKSGRRKSAKGLRRFCEQFSQAQAVVVTPENFLEFLGGHLCSF